MSNISWTEVIETRTRADGTVRRRYQCANAHRFTTLEKPMTPEKKPDISQSVVAELFTYSATSGALHWRNGNGRRVRAGEAAGTVSDQGYVRVVVDRRRYAAHRLVWILHHGAIPPQLVVDHINGARSDNRIENLRLVTHNVNMQNKPHPKGYTKIPSGFRAQICVDGKQKVLGVYKTEAEATTAYRSYKRNVHDAPALEVLHA